VCSLIRPYQCLAREYLLPNRAFGLLPSDPRGPTDYAGTGIGIYGAYTGIGIYAAGTGIYLYGSTANVSINSAATGLGIYASGTGISTANAGGNAVHNNMPPFIAFSKIIRT
jgi:hypothetical protein